MKLRNVRPVGRYKNTQTGKEYNIKQGTRVGRSTDHYFYLYMGKRQFLSDAEFHSPLYQRVDMALKAMKSMKKAIVLPEKLEVIYSLEQGQAVAVFAFKPEMVVTQQAFIDFCLNALDIKYSFSSSVDSHFGVEKKFGIKGAKDGHEGEREFETPKVVKLSGCMIFKGKSELYSAPKWWDAANGKVYFRSENSN